MKAQNITINAMRAFLAFSLFFTISSHLCAQSSFRIQIDTSKYNIDPAIDIATDGGIFFGFVDDIVKVIKLDSAANLVWSRNYGMTLVGVNYERIQILSTSDTGFYLLTPAEEDMFSWFEFPYLRKIDRNGFQQHLFTANSGPLSFGNSLSLGAVNRNNDDLYIFGTSHGYDSYYDQVCCPEPYEVITDSALIILHKKIPIDLRTIKRLFYDASGIPFFIQGSMTNYFPDSGFYHISQFDSLRNQIWKRNFNYDTTQIRDLTVMDIAQFNNEWYVLLNSIINSRRQLCLHKLDSQWNSVYFNVLDTTAFPSQNKFFYNMDMEISESGKILIAGIMHTLLPPNGITSLLIEADTSGSINYSWLGSDYFYFMTVKIDTVDNAAYFARRTDNPGAKYYQFERQYANSPTCNYVPYPLNPISMNLTGSLIDSGIVALISPIPAFQPLTVIPGTYSPAIIPICGITSGVMESDSETECIMEIAPNPIHDSFRLNVNCPLMENSIIKIYDVYGNEVIRIPADKIALPFELNVKFLKSGIYYVNAMTENSIPVNLKLLKM